MSIPSVLQTLRALRHFSPLAVDAKMVVGTWPFSDDMSGWRLGGGCATSRSSPRESDSATITSSDMAVSWDGLRPATRAYVGAVSAAGLALVASVASQLTHRDAALFAALVMLALIVSFAKVRLRTPGTGVTITTGCVIDFTALLILGLPAATMTAVVGVWSQLSFHGRRPTPAYQMWFSLGAVALAIQASGRTYALVAGQLDQPTAVGLATAGAVAAGTYFLVNSMLLAGAMGLSTERRPFEVWMAEFGWSWPGYLFGFSLAAVAAAAIAWSALALAPLAVMLFVLTYRNLKAYVQHATESLTDPLTNLPNRRCLTAHVARELSRSVREDVPMSVVLIDLDDFKVINDTYGHHAGDLALVEVAERLQQLIRVYDICARYGGDEFVVVLAGCDAENAARRAETLRRAVADLVLGTSTPVRLPLQISVGVSAFPADGQTLYELLAVADTRMFSEKWRTKGSRARPTSQPNIIRSMHQDLAAKT